MLLRHRFRSQLPVLLLLGVLAIALAGGVYFALNDRPMSHTTTQTISAAEASEAVRDSVSRSVNALGTAAIGAAQQRYVDLQTKAMQGVGMSVEEAGAYSAGQAVMANCTHMAEEGTDFSQCIAEGLRFLLPEDLQPGS